MLDKGFEFRKGFLFGLILVLLLLVGTLVFNVVNKDNKNFDKSKVCGDYINSLNLTIAVRDGEEMTPIVGYNAKNNKCEFRNGKEVVYSIIYEDIGKK